MQITETQRQRAEILIDAVEDDDNEYGTATAAWTSWQDRAEALADLLAEIIRNPEAEQEAALEAQHQAELLAAHRAGRI